MQFTITCRAQMVHCAQQQQRQHRQAGAAAPQQQRRRLLAGLGAAALTLSARPALAAFPGIESIDLPSVDVPAAIAEKQARNRAVLDQAEESFQQSDLLRTLKERSEANRDERKRALADKYCMRQAELGVGDCGGLRYIPGMTKSGVQKRPEWMDKLFRLEGEAQEPAAQRCCSSYSGLGSAAGSSDSEDSPAAAAAELARLRGRQAQLDGERAALEEQLDSLEERQEALFEEEEALAERERQLQSLMGSQEASGWSVDAGSGWSIDSPGGGSGGEERQEWGPGSEEPSDEEDWRCDPEQRMILRAKWVLDDCRTLAECRQRLREQIVWLRQLEQEGWQLEQPVQGDYGDLWRELPEGSKGPEEP